MQISNIVGKDLDGKYRIEKELGRGGMGAVYLATHLGTERPVAVKIIAPQFMKRAEFVERFRREARAAGRLRHPNVVDVTDFGFAHTDDGEVAYLVMEYLDGCTLGEILDEEKRLPVSWTLDIIEQISSAVHEAHQQGIIHRDLKPDNIWLEPNQRGGYTVKVLDFGIAKVDGHYDPEEARELDRELDLEIAETAARAAKATETVALSPHSDTMHDGSGHTQAGAGGTLSASPDVNSTAVLEGETMIQPIASLKDGHETGDADSVGTRILDADSDGEISAEASGGSATSLRTFTSDTNLTRVGAVLGTPLYMSPEQCRGERLDARSDVYSLGVITYQMLSGKTPFEGNFREVMEAHKTMEPPPLTAKKVRRKMRKVIVGALSKDPADRPQSAEAFAIGLRSRSEGILGLLRNAAMIYTEHLPKFILLSTFFWIPMLVFTAVLVGVNFLGVSGVIPETIAQLTGAVLSILIAAAGAFTSFMIVGTITWIVTQNMAVPLRPLSLRAALRALRSKWRTFAFTGMLSTLMALVGSFAAGFAVFILLMLGSMPFGGFEGAMPIVAVAIGGVVGLIAFVVLSVGLMLLGPSIMMEDSRGLKAVRRSIELVRRAWVTAMNTFIILFLVPLITASIMTGIVNLAAGRIDPTIVQKESSGLKVDVGDDAEAKAPGGDGNGSLQIGIASGSGAGIKITDPDPDVRKRLKHTLMDTMMQILILPVQIIITSFTAIIIALLYLKTRQVGGESLQSLLYHFEESGRPRKRWQERIKRRLGQSGRISERSNA